MKTKRIFKVRTSLDIKEGAIEAILREAYKNELKKGGFIIAYEVEPSQK